MRKSIVFSEDAMSWERVSQTRRQLCGRSLFDKYFSNAYGIARTQKKWNEVFKNFLSDNVGKNTQRPTNCKKLLRTFPFPFITYVFLYQAI